MAHSPQQQQVQAFANGPPAKAARLTSPRSATAKATLGRPRSGSSAGVRSDGMPSRLSVFARLPASCPFVGNFHYAPSAGNRAYSFFEGQIVPHRETERLHKIKTNPLTGNFHSRPGHYSRLHGLKNFRKNADRVVMGDEGMRVIIARIKTDLTEPSSSAVAEATAQDVSLRAGTTPLPALTYSRRQHQTRSLNRAAPEFHTMMMSASDASSAASGGAVSALSPRESTTNIAGRTPYNKYWDDADTERGRFGSSVDDNAVGSSSPPTAGSAAMVEAAVAAGIRGLGKGGVHWGKHHHHHGAGHDESRSEPLIGDATLRLRHLYFQRKQEMRANLAIDRAKVTAPTAHREGARGGGTSGRLRNGYVRVGPILTTRRSAPDALTAALVEVRGRGGGAGAGPPGRARRASYAGRGWESHTLKAQQKTDEYMQGREALAPDMRPAVVLDNEVSLAYDVDLEETGLLGAGAYGTVLAAVHRSTGRQVAIKTMVKKYLFSDAEKASVEREIEIQQRLVNNHIIRLYEIYQSPEKLYLVLERAPCGSLEEFLYVRGRMNELDAKRVVKQLLDGVGYLHQVGVVHCDLKPANILLSDIDQGENALADVGSGASIGTTNSDRPVKPRAQTSAPPTSLKGLVVKICDFGHTRKVPDCRYYKFTGDINKIPFHMFKHTGTEGFVAPEVLVQEPYGKAADMWSTGCMLYKMLTGRMPWIPARKCLQTPLSTTGFAWKNVGEEAKSLVEDLLNTDQAFRANVEQATHHPWFDGMDHCARMPTTAPGGKVTGIGTSGSGRGNVSPNRLGDPWLEEAFPLSEPSRAEGNIAAGGGRGAGKAELIEHQTKQQRPKKAGELHHLVARGRASASGAPKSMNGTDLSVQVA